MKWIEGGVTAPKGFKAAGIHCGIRSNKDKNDLALIYAEVPCAAAGMFTRNAVQAAPVLLNKETIKDGCCQAIIANSGIANACAPNGLAAARRMRQIAADALGIEAGSVLVSSTGVIGVQLPIEPIAGHIDELVDKLTDTPEGSDQAARGIMTTDTRKKEAAVEFTLAEKTVRIGGIAKGSGMIHPNMGTMLGYLTTDVNIGISLLKEALKDVCRVTFNRISVDGDTSTNDTLIIMADGLSENTKIEEKNEDYETFKEALRALCTKMARDMARDGEGATHLVTCHLMNAASEEEAEILAKSVISSSLTKAAIFGADANWGRVLCALGYAGIAFDMHKVDIAFASNRGRISVCEKGIGLPFDEEKAKKILSQEEVIIEANMHRGHSEAVCWGCDLTYDYVRINGDYRT